ncbi:hypothetical protein Tco_0517116 [Tanacetum coccineum]
MPSADSYSAADVTILNTHRTPILKQPELLLCLVGLSRSYFLGDDVYPTFLYDDDRDMDLFNLISALNLAKDIAVASGSSGTPSALMKSPLDFANEDPPQMITEMGRTADQVQDGLSHKIPPVETATTTEVVQEPRLEKEVAAMGPHVNKRSHKRGNDKAEANAPPKVLRKDHAAFRPAQSTIGGKSLALMGLKAGSTFFTPAMQETPADAKSVSDPKSLSSRKTAPEIPTKNVATVGVQDLLSTDSPGSVAIGSQLRLRFEKEVRLLKKATAKIARRDQRIQAREREIKRLDQEIKSLRTMEAEVRCFCNRTKNLETLLESEALCQFRVVNPMHEFGDSHALRGPLHASSFNLESIHEILDGLFIPLLDIVDFH